MEPVKVDDLDSRPMLTKSDLEAAKNCLDALASDEREPQRYRDWYMEAAINVGHALDETAWEES